MSKQYMFDSLIIFVLATILGIGACTVVVGHSLSETARLIEILQTQDLEV
jgi:hypothetical protein